MLTLGCISLIKAIVGGRIIDDDSNRAENHAKQTQAPKFHSGAERSTPKLEKTWQHDLMRMIT